MIIRVLLVSLLVLSGGRMAFAKTLVFVDQHDKPLSNVVVTTTSMAPDTMASSAPAVMDQVNKQFDPYVLLIEQGRQVVFPNSDDIRHHVYSFSQAKPFEIKLYSGDSVAPITFDNSGVVVLGCNIHDSMIGYIYVHNNAQAWLTSDDGSIRVPENVQAIKVWHPHLFVVKNRVLDVAVSDSSETQTVMLELKATPEAPKKANTFQKRSFGG